MRIKEKIQRSLKFSFLDGVFVSAMIGLTADYIIPYALALKATAKQIGALAAIPNLISSLIQLKSPEVTNKIKSRKRIIVIFVFLHTLMAVPIIMIPYFFKWQPVWFLILFVTLFVSFNTFIGPAWSSLICDHVPLRVRGRYFAWRNTIFGIVAICCSFLAGYILHRNKYDIFYGFIIIFTAAFVCRLISWFFMAQMYEPPFHPERKSYYFSIFDFVKSAKESNFSRYVVYVAGFNFCVNLAAPFFAVYMLRDLKYDYLVYTVVVTTITVASIVAMKRWGRHADKVGNLKVLKLTSLLLAASPLLWLVNQHPLYIILVQIFSGFAWSGFNLCATNFIYDAVVTVEKRTRCIAYFNVLTGTATCLGAITGAYLLNVLPGLFGYKMLSLFLISAIARFLVIIPSLPIKEVRPHRKVTHRELLLSMVGIKPIVEVTEDIHQVFGKLD